MTSFKPEHNPPQVTIPARVWRGLKNSFLRGPANSKKRSLSGIASETQTIFAGTRSASSTHRLSGELKRGLPRVVMFIYPGQLNLRRSEWLVLPAHSVDWIELLAQLVRVPVVARSRGEY